MDSSCDSKLLNTNAPSLLLAFSSDHSFPSLALWIWWLWTPPINGRIHFISDSNTWGPVFISLRYIPTQQWDRLLIGISVFVFEESLQHFCSGSTILFSHRIFFLVVIFLIDVINYLEEVTSREMDLFWLRILKYSLPWWGRHDVAHGGLQLNLSRSCNRETRARRWALGYNCQGPTPGNPLPPLNPTS